MGQEGYGTGGAYNAIDDDRSSLAESILQYAERATQAEGKVNELERRLTALEMGPPPTQPQTGYYAPQMAYGMIPGGHPRPTYIQIPPAYQQLQQKSNGGKRNNNEYNCGDLLCSRRLFLHLGNFWGDVSGLHDCIHCCSASRRYSVVGAIGMLVGSGWR